MKGPTLVHVVTEKGKGYSFAEAAPDVSMVSARLT